MRTLRLFLVVAGVHLFLSYVTVILVVGAAYGAHRGWEPLAGERLVFFAQELFAAPIGLLRLVLPPGEAPFGEALLLPNSCLVAAIVTGARIAWRRRRVSPAALHRGLDNPA